MKDEHPRLLQVGPLRRELFVEDEPHPVLVRAALRVAGRVPVGNSYVMSAIFPSVTKYRKGGDFKYDLHFFYIEWTLSDACFPGTSLCLHQKVFDEVVGVPRDDRVGAYLVHVGTSCRNQSLGSNWIDLPKLS